MLCYIIRLQIDVGIGVEDVGQAFLLARVFHELFIAFANVAVLVESGIAAYFTAVLRRKHRLGQVHGGKKVCPFPAQLCKRRRVVRRIAAERFRLGELNLFRLDRFFVFAELRVCARAFQKIIRAILRLFAQVEIITLYLLFEFRLPFLARGFLVIVLFGGLFLRRKLFRAENSLRLP